MSKECPEASALLGILAFFNPDDILLVLFNIEEDLQAPVLLDRRLERYAIEAALNTLQTYSLVHWRDDQHSYYIHKLVHAWAFDRLEESDQRSFSISVLHLLSIQVSKLSNSEIGFKSRLVPHVVACFRPVPQLHMTVSISEEDILSLLETLGAFLRAMGQWPAECQVREFILTENDLLNGREDPSTLTSMNNLAFTLKGLNRDIEALDLLSSCLELLTGKLGTNHPNTLACAQTHNTWNMERSSCNLQ